jgi:hypothetical protein
MGGEPAAGGGLGPPNSGADELTAANQETPYANVSDENAPNSVLSLIIPMSSASATGRFDP